MHKKYTIITLIILSIFLSSCSTIGASDNYVLFDVKMCGNDLITHLNIDGIKPHEIYENVYRIESSKATINSILKWQRKALKATDDYVRSLARGEKTTDELDENHLRMEIAGEILYRLDSGFIK